MKKLQLAADGGNVASIQQLCRGHAYGVEGIPFDASAALRRCTQGAQVSDPASITLLGSLHEDGKGLSADPFHARELFERAAGMGNQHAQFLLARMYEKGIGGVQNLDLAESLLLAAATKGHAGAKKQLAERAGL